MSGALGLLADQGQKDRDASPASEVWFSRRRVTLSDPLAVLMNRNRFYADWRFPNRFYAPVIEFAWAVRFLHVSTVKVGLFTARAGIGAA